MKKLPDEILKEILMPPLQVPDGEFSFTGRACDSPFGRTARNSASLLVVSKQWMRVATPLLYEVVVIRSTVQAKALAYAIESNKTLGMFIKRLRMEGGFGKAPAQFIASAPNIRELFVTLDLWSIDNPSGLCSALSGMDLSRLVINHKDSAIKKRAVHLWQSLSACIPHWSNLEILEYHSTYRMARIGRSKYSQLVTLLKDSPSVKHIVIDPVPRHVLAQIALVTSIQTISVESLHSELRDFVSSNPRLLKLVQIRRKFPDEPTPDMFPLASATPSFKPLENVPKHTANSIWDLIFSFATHSYCAERPPQIKPLNDPHLNPRRASFYSTARYLSMVSKSFRGTVRRHLFSIVQVESSQQFLAFCNTINDNRTLPVLIRVLRVNFRRSLQIDYDHCMAQLLPKLTGLVNLDIPLINLRQLMLLDPAALTNLQTLDIQLAVCDQGSCDAVELGVLGGLSYFRCRYDILEALRHSKRPLPALIVDLPNLTSLSMGTRDCEDTLDAFCTVRMPSLTHLQLCGNNMKTHEFLRLNGETVKVLEIFDKPSSAIWTWCPRLEHLSVWCEPRSLLKSLLGGQKHSSLSKLHFLLRVSGSNIEKAMLSATAGSQFVNFSHFPNFREIHIRGLRWPNTEHEINRNQRCNSFSLCMKRRGIVVYDESGTPWRERALARRRR
ncbi:hypothetical protein BD410DRAFT_780490 [Rickenella mellea]|uniref:F-box domain-containing protein n=1 Tax=Rickenella mellea TaxID=50990 RepID=A0A4R5XFS2_9AGAM|nr:hypothetical protein BD410DRAFT_780490 [Rickenella mellea]